MHPDHRATALGVGAFELAGIEVGRGLVDVDEDGSRAHAIHGRGRGEEGVRGQDDFVAATDSQAQECESEGVGARIHPDRVPDPRRGREVRFEAGQCLALDEITPLKNGGDGLFDLCLNRLELRTQIDEGNRLQ